MANTIFCHYELARFPQDEFRKKPDGSLYNPAIHETDNPHWITGVPLNPGTIAGIESKRVELISQLYNMSMQMDEAELNELVEVIKNRGDYDGMIDDD